ncbi:hypothetical protein N8198_02740 [Gammaproteobacteria bacterium]|nr:hypothetical protein [Gammaproteobacteria bacterium]
MNKPYRPHSGGESGLVAYLVDAYADLLWRPLISKLKPLGIGLSRAFSILGIRRLPFHSIGLWLVTGIALLTAVGFVLAIAGLMLAHSGVPPLAELWDQWALTAYQWGRLHKTWWIVIGVAMAGFWLIVRPFSIHRIGARRLRFTVLAIGYGFLSTLSVVLAWQFQSDLHLIEWWLALTIFIFCHFLFVFSVAVMMSITSKIISVNRAYLLETETALEDQRDPLAYLFDGSLYGFVIRRGVERILDKYVGGWAGGDLYRLLRRGLVGVVNLLSFAWLIDRIFGKPRFVQHFDSLLQWRAQRAREQVFGVMQDETLLPALEKSTAHFDVKYTPFDAEMN